MSIFREIIVIDDSSDEDAEAVICVSVKPAVPKVKIATQPTVLQLTSNSRTPSLPSSTKSNDVPIRQTGLSASTISHKFGSNNSIMSSTTNAAVIPSSTDKNHSSNTTTSTLNTAVATASGSLLSKRSRPVSYAPTFESKEEDDDNAEKLSVCFIYTLRIIAFECNKFSVCHLKLS